MGDPGPFVPDDQLDIDDDGIARYEGSLFSGVSVEEGPGGVRSEMPYVNGLLEGLAHDVDLVTGRRVRETRYWHGMRHGPEREFHPDGSVREEGMFEYDVQLRHVVRSMDGNVVEDYRIQPSSSDWRFLQMQRQTFASTDAGGP